MRSILWLILVFGLLSALPVWAADTAANTGQPAPATDTVANTDPATVAADDPADADQPGARGRMSPEMRRAMMRRVAAFIDNLLVMGQNTAVDTPEGVIILQGNNLLQYGNDLVLRRTVALPLPPVVPMDATNMPAPGGMPARPPMPPLRSMLPAKLLVMANGDLVFIRGLQIIRFDHELKIINQATLAEIPPLTPEELSAVAPMGAYVTMMMMMGPMAGGGRDGGGMGMGMGSTPEMPAPTTEPAPAPAPEPAPAPPQPGGGQ